MSRASLQWRARELLHTSSVSRRAVPHTSAQAGPLPAISTTVTTLFIGGLDPGVTETELRSFLAQVAPCTVKIPVDSVTRVPRDFAYANFLSPEEAASVIKSLNYQVLHGRMIRIMPKQTDPSLRKSGVAAVVVRPLPEDIAHRELHDFFDSEVGGVVCVRVATAGTKPKGHGYVQFNSKEQAERAQSKELKLRDQTLKVEQYQPRSVRMKNIRFTNVYVKGFPLTWDDDKLREAFSGSGNVTSLCVRKVTVKDEDRAFGFVNYETSEQAVKAISEMHDKVVTDSEGKEDKLSVQRAMSKAERERLKREAREARRRNTYQSTRGRDLYVKPLGADVDDAGLHRMFSEFGEIESAHVMTKEGSSQGFGFVRFRDPAEATRAIEAMHGRVVNGAKMVVTHFVIEEEQQRQLEREMRQRQQASFNMPMNPMGAMNPMLMMQAMAAGRGTVGGMPNPYPAGNMPQMQLQQLLQQQMYRAQQAQAQAQAQAQGAAQGGAGTYAQSIGGYTTEQLLALDASYRTDVLGNELYPLVAEHMDEERAGKITGMLLDLEPIEVIGIIMNEADRRQRVEEAIGVLEGASAEADDDKEAEGEQSTSLAGQEDSTRIGACVVCMDAQRNAAPIPCGHVSACYECLQGISSAGQGCPVCRQPMQEVVRLYIA